MQFLSVVVYSSLCSIYRKSFALKEATSTYPLFPTFGEEAAGLNGFELFIMK